MKPQTQNWIIASAIAAAGSIMASSAHAVPLFQSSTSLLHYTDAGDGPNRAEAIDSQFNNAIGPAASSISGALVSDVNYVDLQNEDYVPVSHTINYASQTSSSNSGLRWYQSASAISAFRDEAIEGEFDPNYSVIEGFSLDASVGLDDSLLLSGGSGLEFIQVSLQLDGAVIRDGDGFADNFIQIRSGSDTIFNSFFDDYETFHSPGEQEVNRTLITGLIPVVNGVADIDFSVTSSLGFAFGGEGGSDEAFLNYLDFSSVMDFSSTLLIDQISGFNADGDQVDLESAKGSDGFVYSTARVDSDAISVPEPSSFILLTSSLLGLVLMRRRSSPVRC